MKERLDVLLVKRNLAESREKAKAVIMAGNVFVEGQREDKAGTTFPDTVQIEVRGHVLPYVSRGGLKLEKAIANFDVSVDGKVCTDVGSSTGGFTDCMLQNGARKVFAIDVGRGQLDWKLRQDERVVCMEKTNIRYVDHTCFYRQIVGNEYDSKNPLQVFESVYATIADRKQHPKEGSYTNYLFDKGIDKILKKVGEEATEIVIAAKNPNPEEIKYEISDFLYHAMVLMVERGVTWEDIVKELADR